MNPKKTNQTKLKINKAIITSIGIIASVAIYFFVSNSYVPKFNGEKAFNHLVTQVNFGSRTSGSEAHEKARQYFLSTLKKYTDRVEEQPFQFIDVHDSTKIYNGKNIVASFNVDPKVSKRILLCAHYDSRPFADEDPDSTKRSQPVPGANDGASGVAVLLEMASLFYEKTPEVGVDIVLFDLEDIGEKEDSLSNELKNPYAIGSSEFVKNNPKYKPAFGILLDMVGDKNLKIKREQYSEIRAKWVNDKVWEAAVKVGANAFIDEPGGGVMDDHIVFLQNRIPVIDLIHWPFPEYWHTTNDLPENCSPESLQQIGDVLVEIIYNEN